MIRRLLAQVAARLHRMSIRTRLLIAYVGLLLIGFLALTLVAGSQIALAARADYEQRLLNEVRLVQQGLRAVLYSEGWTEEAEAALAAQIAEYEAHLNASIVLHALNEREGPQLRGSFRDAPEMETAIRDGVVVVQRDDDQGRPALFTAVALGDGGREGGQAVVQLSVPLENLTLLITQRWLLLLLVLAVILAVTVAAALWVARSIIRPLYTLRDSALRLSRGDLAIRVANPGDDEIGALGRAFNEMAAQVQGMLEEQRAFASNTSHELRTPLTTIRLRSEALRYDDSLDEAMSAQYIVEIDEEIGRLSSMIADLTLLSRFDAGRTELGQSEIDLVRLAVSLTQQHLASAAERGVTLELIAPEAIIPIRGSLNHLLIIFRNLLENAIKYTPQGGRVTWTIRQEAGGVRSILQDTGQGISPDNLAHVFERFFRADRSRARDVPGTGLGLALVKSIVDAYGGSVTLESAGLNRGTTATVFLPAPSSA
ncbi:MAG: HAMP domain-containing histidine kinase [Anaerolineae bacterium]|nr:HAMP domain-containing histidine kinase [Anaerolineae bacterium]NUQ04480.1 HAMP domain-containing histidine kinase [Anaerolineae bacterium]